MKLRTTLTMLAAIAGLSTSAAADALSPLVVFGQKYKVNRVDYSLVTWPDPANPGFNLQLIEVEGAHWLGNDRLLLSTDALDSLLSLKNWVIEVQLVRDGNGDVTGLTYVRTVLINDPVDTNYGGFDLSPCGVTINTGSTGLGANGNLLIGDSEQNGVAGYASSNGAFLGSWSGGTNNDSFDDLVYVPTNGLVYTINEDGESLVSFTTSGAFVASTPMPGLTVLDPSAVAGSPKGMTFLPDADTVPARIRRPGGTILVTLDDDNPGLQVFDLTGNVVATKALTDEPIFGGNSLLDQGAACGLTLQLESAAFDADTGTLFLVNEGSLNDCSGFYVLTPVCNSDFDNSGFVDFDDFNQFVVAFEAGDILADFDDSGFVDFDDFNQYVVAFESGC